MTTKKPFNDATDHMSKIEGAPMHNPYMNGLPLGIRIIIIGYVLIGFTAITALCGIVLALFD